MKIVCINNVSISEKGQTRLPLTIGKTYSPYLLRKPEYVSDAGNYLLIDDDGEEAEYYNHSLFITLDEYRDSKLESIGIK